MRDIPSNTKGMQAIGTPQSVPTLSDKQFEWIATRVKSLTGIMLTPQKHVLVQSRMQRRLRQLKMTSFSEYLDYLQGPDGDTETVSFCNALTTNLTSFFREKHHFDHLSEELQAMAARGATRVRIWSAGCSTGQEPYSIAMTVCNSDASRSIADILIDATDIDTNVLSTAQEGKYQLDDYENLPSEMKKFFNPDPEGETASADRRIKTKIKFGQFNLMNHWDKSESYDFIFCRNVMIYFDAETKRALIEKLVGSLKKGGVLYLGHSESVINTKVDLEMIGRTTFRRHN